MRLFDLHCDTLGVLTAGGEPAVDIRRGSRYDRWTQVFAAWLPDGIPLVTARQRCAALLDTADRLAASRDVTPVRTASDLIAPVPACRAILAVENGGALDGDAAYLDTLYRRGVRLVTLTWNGDTPWGSGCFGSGDGLTVAGRQAVWEMELLGITVDVSHLNESGFRQVADMAKHPFIASHSNAAAIHPHPRNLTDDQFRAIRDSGGIVGLNLYGEHLGGWDFTAVQRHLEHFLALGEDAVCVGSDLDGMEIPARWDGIRVFEKLWQHLKGEGYPDTLLDAVFYTNAFSFFERALAAKT